MVAEPDSITKLLVYNTGSGSLKQEAFRRLETAFPNHEVLAVAPGQDIVEAFHSCATPDDAEVVVAGGDGTIEAIARCVAGTGRSLGIIPLGTFNNFANALGLPSDLDAAIAVAQSGEPHWVTLGWVNETPFLEAAAVGLFGDLIAAGEFAKEMQYGELMRLLGAMRGKRFRYEIQGDLQLRGTAESLVFANTPTIGAAILLADTDPAEPHLELEIIESKTRLEMARRLVAGLLRRRPTPGNHARVTQVRVETEPAARVRADATDAAETPVTIRADPRGLRILLPRR